MNSQPVRKRADNVAAASPNTFASTDVSPLVCAAQTWCEHANTRIQYLQGGPHHAKEICCDCGRVLRFIPKPSTVEERAFHAYRIAKLSMANDLSPWEQKFVASITAAKKLSPKQLAVLDSLYDKFQIGGRR